MYQQYQQYQQPVNNVTRVTGIEGARAYQMPPNSVVALFDGGDDLFFFKTTDGAGFPTLRAFRFEEVDIGSLSGRQGQDYVTRDEIEELSRRLDRLMEALGGSDG